MRLVSLRRVSFLSPSIRNINDSDADFDVLDSIAGIMNAAKGGAPPKRRKQVKPKVEDDEEDSDEESGTEEEQDDTSATNTDTEPEN